MLKIGLPEKFFGVIKISISCILEMVSLLLPSRFLADFSQTPPNKSYPREGLSMYQITELCCKDFLSIF
jgi:hypothetical protein